MSRLPQLTALILILLTFCPLVSADEIFDDWVISGSTFEADGQSYTAAYSTGAEKVYWQTPDGNFLLSITECKLIGTRNYCFSELDTEERVVYSAGTMYPALHLIISEAGPDLKVLIEVTDVTPMYGDEFTFTLTAENTGTLSADEFKATLDIPNGITVMSTNGQQQGSKLVFTLPGLSSGQTQTFNANLRPTEVGIKTIHGQYQYVFLGVQKTVAIDGKDITIEQPFTIHWSLSPETLKRNQKASLNISVENKDDAKPLTIDSLTVDVPAAFIISSPSSRWKKEGNILSFNGIVPKKSKLSLAAALALDRGGSYTVKGSYQFTFDQHHYTGYYNTTIGTQVERITPRVVIDDTKLKDEGLLHITASLKNNGAALGNVSVQTAGDLLAKTSLERIDIDAGETYQVISKSISLPPIEETTEYRISISGTYKEEGTTKTFSLSQTYTQQPESRIITSRHDAPRRAAPGEPISIHVEVENQLTTPLIEIDVVDSFPEGFTVSNGTFLATLPIIASKETMSAMDYLLTVPADFTEDSFTISTLINAQLEGSDRVYKYVDKYVIHITDEEETAEAETPPETTTNETTTTPPELQEKAKPSLITRIWNWIKGLFGKSTSEIPTQPEPTANDTPAYPVKQNEQNPTPEPEPTRATDDSDLAKRFAQQQEQP